MNTLDIQIFDVHLTTLLTYLGAFIVLLFHGRKNQFSLQEIFVSTMAVMIPAVLSFETIWIPLNSLMTHVRFYGISSLIINLAIITFSLTIALSTWGHFFIDRIFVTLTIVTLTVWILWLPSFPANPTNREYADTIKLFQTASIVYPFVKR